MKQYKPYFSCKGKAENYVVNGFSEELEELYLTLDQANVVAKCLNMAFEYGGKRKLSELRYFLKHGELYDW